MPTSSADRARHVLACEGRSAAELEALSAALRAGGTAPEPDPEALAEMIAALEGATPLRVALFALVVGGVPLALGLALLLVVAWAAAAM